MLRRRVASVRAALAARGGLVPDEIEFRVAASIAHLSLVARLISPALGGAVTGHRVDLRLDGLWWQDELGSPVPLSVPGADCEAADSHLHSFVEEVVAPVTTATRELAAVSERVLWGNVASGINAAARQAAVSRPHLADGAWRAAGILFASPLLRGERRPPGPAYRRASCCLIYRIVPGGAPAAVCGDCVLNGRTTGRTPDTSGTLRPGQEPS